MIDGAVTMMLLGAAIQAVPPVHNFALQIRRRPNSREVARSLSFMPFPSDDRDLDQLMRAAAAALDART